MEATKQKEEKRKTGIIFDFGRQMMGKSVVGIN
jgi:hypothetical protein